MKIAVTGTGLIGSQVVSDLTSAGHDATGHSRSTGVDLLTGNGLDDAVRDAEAVVDVTNSPTFDDASLDFFRTSVTNLLAAAQAAAASTWCRHGLLPGQDPAGGPGQGRADRVLVRAAQFIRPPGHQRVRHPALRWVTLSR